MKRKSVIPLQQTLGYRYLRLSNVTYSQGAFDTVLDVPPDATLGENSIHFSGSGIYASTSILISNPRIPTTNLEISSDEKVSLWFPHVF